MWLSTSLAIELTVIEPPSPDVGRPGRAYGNGDQNGADVAERSRSPPVVTVESPI